jgi:hypothetical protein
MKPPGVQPGGRRRVKMFNPNSQIIARSQSKATGPVVGLSFLLDALDASQEYWQELPAPHPLFINEVRRALSEAVGGYDGR